MTVRKVPNYYIIMIPYIPIHVHIEMINHEKMYSIYK